MDLSSHLKWALIGGAIGLVIGVLISIAFVFIYICTCKRSRHRKHQGDEQGRDEEEPLRPAINNCSRGNRQVTETETENETTRIKSKLSRHKDGEGRQEDRESLLSTLKKVKTELENQKHQLAEQLRGVESERKKNKEELQSVETKITERQNSDDTESLLKQKGEMLQTQWKLEEKKRNIERQTLNIEKVLEPIENIDEYH